MLTLQQTLDNRSKVGLLSERAIARLREHEPKEGYYLAFSGGKDSVVIHDLAVRAGVKFDPHYSQTTVDPPEVQQFIKEHYPHVAWGKPRNSMFRLIPLKKMVPTLDALKADGKTFPHGSTPEEVMHWWIHNADYDTETVQTTI